MTVTYEAKAFVAGTPQAEVSGGAMSAFLDNLQADEVAPILKDLGIDEIDHDKWYPHQLWFDILKELDKRMGDSASHTFVAFGKQVVKTAIMPPEIQSIPDVLNALHAIHHANLRNIPESEGYALQQLDDQKYIVYQNTPNPDDTIFGFLWGLAARFKESDERFVVRQVSREDYAQHAGTPFLVEWWSEGERK